MKRECGDCQACCKLLPVKGINKPALKRCQHQRHHKGCAVYHKPEKGFPWECGLWECVWLTGNETGDLRRPDHSHYCVDILPDFVTNQTAEGEKIVIPVVQIWIDPKYPDCHRDPALRAWLTLRDGFCGLVRYGNDDAILIIPPYLNDTGEWIEKGSNMREHNHSFGEVLQALGAA
jgi:hypothetical protein